MTLIEPFPTVEGGWKTILADCPWSFGDNLPGKGRGAQKHYDVMTNQDIINMPVKEITAEQCHLYLWTTNTHLDVAFDVMKEWGFDYKTMITWVKVSKAGKIRIGMGRYYRNCTEHVLFGVKGKMFTQNTNLPNVFMAERTLHSAKPENLYEMIRECSPSPRLELFARNKAEGFERWGLEAPE